MCAALKVKDIKSNPSQRSRSPAEIAHVSPGTVAALAQCPPVGCRPRRRTLLLPPLQMMQTNIPGVFAAGDAVTFPLALRNNKKVNVPHWQMAHMHGGCFSAHCLWEGAFSRAPGNFQAL